MYRFARAMSINTLVLTSIKVLYLIKDYCNYSLYSIYTVFSVDIDTPLIDNSRSKTQNNHKTLKKS